MMARTSLPPGFRFHPTDVELVKYHLKRKVLGKKVKFEVISELNIYKYSPWDLPDKSRFKSKDLEWYFFCPKETRCASGTRMNRATDCGYWKTTGKDRHVSYNDQTVGLIKTLVFHKGRAPKGERTDWVMHEYRMVDKELADAEVVQDAYVLCKVFEKSGPGPKNGAQYGAPFNEDDYDEDGEIRAELVLPVALPPSALPSKGSAFFSGSTSGGLLSDSAFVPGSTSSCILSGSTSNGPLSDPSLSNAMVCADEVPPPIPHNFEDIVSMLEMIIPCENGNNEVENFVHVEHNKYLACSDGDDIFSGLGDLGNGWPALSCHQTTGLGLAGNDLYLELNDLANPLCFPADEIDMDTLCGPYDCLQQNYCPLDSVGSVQLDAALNQPHVLPEESQGRGTGHAAQFQNRG